MSLHAVIRFALAAALAGSLAAPTARAATWTVPVPFASIQAAVDAASDGDTVLVSPGVYHQFAVITNKSLVVRGADGPKPELSGPLSLPRAFFRVVTDRAVTVRIERFILRDNAQTFGGSGGAMTALGPMRLELRDLEVLDCSTEARDFYAAGLGGALRMTGGTSLLVEECLFRNNRAVAGAAHDDGRGGALFIDVVGDVEIRNSHFLQNSAGGSDCGGTGGAVHARARSIDVLNCAFDQNSSHSGSAILAQGSLRLVNTRFLRNVSRPGIRWCGGAGGGTVHQSGAYEADGCQFVANVLNGGTGVVTSVGSSAVQLRGCTLAFNGGGSALDATSWSGTSYRVERTLIFGNSAGIRVSSGASVLATCTVVSGNAIDYSGLQPFSEAGGNMAVDPQFCAGSELELLVAENSSLFPGQPGHPEECGVIGAVAVGCVATAIEPTTWSGLKARFGRAGGSPR